MNRARSIGRGEWWFTILSRYSLVLILFGVTVFFSIAAKGFFTVDNFRAIGVNEVVTLFVALGLSATLIVGELDLSVAAILSVTQALTVGLMSFQHLGIVPAVACGIAAAAGIGLVNGLMVVKVGLNSLIATLAMSSVLTGIVIWYTKGASVFANVPLGYQKISNTNLAGVPLPLVYGGVAVIAFELLFGFLPTGRRMYAIGGNRRAALFTGIRVNRLVIGSFVTAGLVSGLGGIIISSRLGSAAPDLGPSFLLPAFAAAFLGATTIRPGRFNALGTVVAVYVLAITISGIQALGAPTWATYIFNGGALAVGVTVAGRLVKLREARAKRDQLRSFEESAEIVSSGDGGDRSGVDTPT